MLLCWIRFKVIQARLHFCSCSDWLCCRKNYSDSILRCYTSSPVLSALSQWKQRQVIYSVVSASRPLSPERFRMIRTESSRFMVINKSKLKRDHQFIICPGSIFECSLKREKRPPRMRKLCSDKWKDVCSWRLPPDENPPALRAHTQICRPSWKHACLPRRPIGSISLMTYSDQYGQSGFTLNAYPSTVSQLLTTFRRTTWTSVSVITRRCFAGPNKCSFLKCCFRKWKDCLSIVTRVWKILRISGPFTSQFKCWADCKLSRIILHLHFSSMKCMGTEFPSSSWQNLHWEEKNSLVTRTKRKFVFPLSDLNCTR